jgi:hypothetical protein
MMDNPNTRLGLLMMLFSAVFVLLTALVVYRHFTADQGMHHKSPDYYSFKATSYLKNGVQKDSILCARKDFPGDFWAVSKAYHGHGKRSFVRDKDASEDSNLEGVCLHTTYNHYNHWAGVQDPQSRVIHWANGSTH